MVAMPPERHIFPVGSANFRSGTKEKGNDSNSKPLPFRSAGSKIPARKASEKAAKSSSSDRRMLLQNNVEFLPLSTDSHMETGDIFSEPEMVQYPDGKVPYEITIFDGMEITSHLIENIQSQEEAVFRSSLTEPNVGQKNGTVEIGNTLQNQASDGLSQLGAEIVVETSSAISTESVITGNEDVDSCFQRIEDALISVIADNEINSCSQKISPVEQMPIHNAEEKPVHHRAAAKKLGLWFPTLRCMNSISFNTASKIFFAGKEIVLSVRDTHKYLPVNICWKMGLVIVSMSCTTTALAIFSAICLRMRLEGFDEGLVPT